jgi:hypothetical protein
MRRVDLTPEAQAAVLAAVLDRCERCRNEQNAVAD